SGGGGAAANAAVARNSSSSARDWRAEARGDMAGLRGRCGGRWTGIAARSLQTRGGAASKAPPAVAAAARIAAESQAGRPGLHQVGYFARFATTGVSIGPWPMSITLVRLSSSPFTLPE